MSSEDDWWREVLRRLDSNVDTASARMAEFATTTAVAIAELKGKNATCDERLSGIIREQARINARLDAHDLAIRMDPASSIPPTQAPLAAVTQTTATDPGFWGGFFAFARSERGSTLIFLSVLLTIASVVFFGVKYTLPGGGGIEPVASDDDDKDGDGYEEDDAAVGDRFLYTGDGTAGGKR